jgi:serine/threonine protein kinase/tetratricopeptide (TPR) repeat protein
MRDQGDATTVRPDLEGTAAGQWRPPEDRVGELAEAFLERHRRGECPSVEEYASDYPELAGEIRRLFPALVMMEDLRPAASDLAGGAAAACGTAPERLGDYRILREVGRGGMGVVYEAEQESLGRRVALKVLAAHGLRNPRQLLRFHREARAAGRLHHTNIVPVFGVGESEGQHYYVMQFIPGLGLDAVLEEIKLLRGHCPKDGVPARPVGGGPSAADVARSLMTGQFRTPPVQETSEESPVPAQATAAVAPASPSSVVLPGQSRGSSATDSAGRYARSVALIGVQVAEALDYAHRQGTLHRDIKPSNLLLDGQGNVWVADFGLAKAADSDDLTHTGDIVGTIRYMAPERFEGRCDARSDVYALGLTLYELLALRPAFDRSDRVELIRQVTHEEPPRLGAVDPTIPRDLRTVVHKAIEREPNRRYVGAGALAEDLRRFLEGRPIRARRVSPPEHAWRWCRRNPAVAGLAAAAFLAMAVGMAVSTWQAIRARRAVAAEKAANLAAQAREADAQAVLEFVEDRVLAAARPEGQARGLGHAITLRKAIDAALPFVAENFAAQPLIEARLRRTLGQSYLYLGEAQTAADQFEASRAIYARHRGPDDPETLASTQSLSASYFALGRHAEALKLRERILARRRAELGPDHPDTLTSMHGLAACYAALGRHAEALKLLEKTLALRTAKLGRDHPDTLTNMNNLANSYDDLGRHAEALEVREKTLALRTARLGSHHPDTLTSMNNLALSYEALDRRAEALKLYEDVLALRRVELGPDHPDTLDSISNLALTYDTLGRRAEALVLHEEALAMYKARQGPDHPDTLLRRISVASCLVHLGRGAEAAADCRRAAEAWENLGGSNASSLYNAACFRAATAAALRAADKSPAGAQQAEAEADRAMAWLERAVAAGFRGAANVAEDHDLDALRHRADFKELLERLRAAKPK